jgi:hypothetical protein
MASNIKRVIDMALLIHHPEFEEYIGKGESTCNTVGLTAI